MLVDTHTHLYLEEFQPTPEDAVRRAIDLGVELMVFPNVDLNTIEPMKRLCFQFPENTVMAMGLHPTEVNENWQSDLSVIQNELSNGNYVAIGEVGIDLYWDKTYREEQKQVLDIQLQWAVERQLPVILHCREGLDDILEVMDKRSGNLPQCVFHSFGGTADDVMRIRERGDFYFGINGIVTFKNSKLREVLGVIGIDRILLETDAPYLAPVPHRGKRNESRWMWYVVERLAQVYNCSAEYVNEVTTAAAKALFVINL